MCHFLGAVLQAKTWIASQKLAEANKSSTLGPAGIVCWGSEAPCSICLQETSQYVYKQLWRATRRFPASWLRCSFGTTLSSGCRKTAHALSRILAGTCPKWMQARTCRTWIASTAVSDAILSISLLYRDLPSRIDSVLITVRTLHKLFIHDLRSV